MKQAAKSAEQVKQIAAKAAETQAIDPEDAMETKNAAENVQKAAAVGDQTAAVMHSETVQDRMGRVTVIGANTTVLQVVGGKGVLNVYHPISPDENFDYGSYSDEN